MKRRSYVDTAHKSPLAVCNHCLRARAAYVINFTDGSTSNRCTAHTSKEYDR